MASLQDYRWTVLSDTCYSVHKQVSVNFLHPTMWQPENEPLLLLISIMATSRTHYPKTSSWGKSSLIFVKPLFRKQTDSYTVITHMVQHMMSHNISTSSFHFVLIKSPRRWSNKVLDSLLEERNDDSTSSQNTCWTVIVNHKPSCTKFNSRTIAAAQPDCFWTHNPRPNPILYT